MSKKKVYKGLESLGEAFGITTSEKKEKKYGQNKPGKVHTQKTKGIQEMITNAGHYYYVKGKGHLRDFGQRLPDYALPDLVGQQSTEESLAYIKNHFKIIQSERDTAQTFADSGLPTDQKSEIRDCKLSFELTTTYPGLLTGAGYMHPIAESNDDDFQSGFYFDWTTGLPVLPGSTVKGVLRSVFPKEKESKDIKKAKVKYLMDILNGIQKDIISSSEKFIKALETNIFEDKGDIFYDAYISGIPDSGKIFAEDYITPHPSPFSNPIPLRFLKIAPGVTFKFQFKLKESKLDNGITVTPENKKELFKKILIDFGIGAKRNTGYGMLI